MMNGTPKNLIIITSDEMRGDCQGFSGNPDVKTPSLDSFARKGVVFENHFTCHGKCVPSRMAMSTGRFPHTDGIRTVNETNLLPAGSPDILWALKNRGYETAVFGLNHVWAALFSSNEKGRAYADYHSWVFDAKTGFDYGGMFKEPVVVPEPDEQSAPVLDEKEFPLLGEKRELKVRRLTGDIACNGGDDGRARQAVDYLTRRRDRSRPFFMQLNISKPHPAYEVEEPWFSMYDREKIRPFPHDMPSNAPLHMRRMREIRSTVEPMIPVLRQLQAVYYGMITKVDTLIGGVLDTITKERLWDNTVVLFTADHGDFAAQHALSEKWDTCMSDCLLHIPCILWTPQLSKKGGQRVKSLTQNTDIAPTLCDLAGIEQFPGIQGKSLLPVIGGKETRDAVFAGGGHEDEMIARAVSGARFSAKPERPLDGKQLTYQKCPDAMARTKMVRTAKWKLVVRLRGGNELYDMENDPWELDNRYGDPALNGVVMDLQQRLIEWCIRTDTDRPHQERVGA